LCHDGRTGIPACQPRFGPVRKHAWLSGGHIRDAGFRAGAFLLSKVCWPALLRYL
ncbi:hypothetical protein HDV03_000423, partial [Kappamyces sp. JEL0829]